MKPIKLSHMIFSIRTFLTQYLRPKYALLFLTLVAGYSFAVEQTNNDADVIDAVVQIMNLFFVMLTILMTPAIIMAGWLLSPDWTMGDFFGLRAYFIQIWVLVSNLTYIVFALLLLYMAVLQIFSSESNYAFKKKLPRFLVGILIVPFTWLIVSWTLSFANQAVAAVLSIPMGAISSMQDTGTKKSSFHSKVIPTKFKIAFGEDAPGAGAESVSCGDNGRTPDDTKCISPAEFVTYNQSGPFFIILIYAYDIFKVQNTNLLSLGSACGGNDTGSVNAQSCINNLAQLASKLGVSLITTVFFVFLLIALCWVLLARAFKLWIYVMFSPLFGLAYAVGDEGLGKSLESSDGGGHGGGGIKIGELGFMPFFKLAMVPVLVAGVLSFGLLFIGVIESSLTGGVLEDNGAGTFCTGDTFMVKYCITQDGSQKEGYTSMLIIGTDETNSSTGGGAGDYTIRFEFGSMISSFVGNSAAVGNVVGGAGAALTGSRDIFAQIILSILALIVMWMGIKAAVNHDDITRAAFEPFSKFGESVGSFVQHIPSYIPTPHPAFKALTPDFWSTAGDTLRRVGDEHAFEERKQLQEFMTNPGLMKLDSVAKNASSSLEDLSQAIKDTSVEQLNSSTAGMNALKEGMKRVIDKTNISDEEKNRIKGDINVTTSSSGLVTIINSESALQNVNDPASKSIIDRVQTAAKTPGSTSWAVITGATFDPSTKKITLGSGGPKIDVASGNIETGNINPTQKENVKKTLRLKSLDTKDKINASNDTVLRPILESILGSDALPASLTPQELKNIAIGLL